MPRWTATSAAAALIRASAQRFTKPPARRRPDHDPAPRVSEIQCSSQWWSDYRCFITNKINPAFAAGDPAAVNAWVRIAPDNTVTILCARSEMGQGVVMALPTLVAEELEVDLDKIKVDFAPPGDV